MANLTSYFPSQKLADRRQQKLKEIQTFRNQPRNNHEANLDQAADVSLRSKSAAQDQQHSESLAHRPEQPQALLDTLDDDLDYLWRLYGGQPGQLTATSLPQSAPSTQFRSNAQIFLDITTKLRLLSSATRLLYSLDPESTQTAQLNAQNALQQVRADTAGDTVLEARCNFYIGVANYISLLDASLSERIPPQQRPMRYFERALEAEKRYPEGKWAQQWINFHESLTLSPTQVMPAIQLTPMRASYPSKGWLGWLNGSAEKVTEAPQAVGLSRQVVSGERIPSFTTWSSSPTQPSADLGTSGLRQSGASEQSTSPSADKRSEPPLSQDSASSGSGTSQSLRSATHSTRTSIDSQHSVADTAEGGFGFGLRRFANSLFFSRSRPADAEVDITSSPEASGDESNDNEELEQTPAAVSEPQHHTNDKDDDDKPPDLALDSPAADLVKPSSVRSTSTPSVHSPGSDTATHKQRAKSLSWAKSVAEREPSANASTTEARGPRRHQRRKSSLRQVLGLPGHQREDELAMAEAGESPKFKSTRDWTNEVWRLGE